MEPHLIELPRRIVVGRGAILEIEEVCDKLGIIGRPLVMFGPHTKQICIGKIQDMLDSMGALIEIVREASLKEVRRIEKSKYEIECIISIGGGKVIDVGKMVAYDKGLPFISVPTAPSHDGIASERVSLRNGMPYSLKAKTPLAIIADIDILMNAPYRLIASGAADIISNFTAINDWQLARRHGEYYSDYAAALSILAAEMVTSSARLIRKRRERGIRNLIEALISSGIAISLAGSSRPASGSEHLFSHALDMLGSKALHGEQCGVGTIIMAYLQGQEWKTIRDTLKAVGAPTNIYELGIERDKLIKALLMARDIRKRYTILNTISMDKKSAIKICKEVGVL
ncbi:MAG TPA: NAD(P)-dependent glycerol-1-phosphate dehydrogenase [Candidatus Aenigmarchaeota archaeon]|nr:NAD(P)-dependent glycerol-1-phosphate dehydrogenase [Candidatus Aenigmarchaeota archaeon]